MAFHRSFFGRSDFAVHDSTVPMMLLYPEIFSDAQQLCIDVETQGTFTRGVTIADLRKSISASDEETKDTASSSESDQPERPKNVTAYLNIDSDAAKRIFLEHIQAYPSQGHENGKDEKAKAKGGMKGKKQDQAKEAGTSAVKGTRKRK